MNDKEENIEAAFFSLLLTVYRQQRIIKYLHNKIVDPTFPEMDDPIEALFEKAEASLNKAIKYAIPEADDNGPG